MNRSLKPAFLILICAFLLIPATLFADETELPEEAELPLEEEEPSKERDRACLFFTLGPVGILNTDKLSAPSPIKFSAGIGGTLPVSSWFAFAPSLSMFTNYYLWRNDWAGGWAYPAEVENRTALVASALIDIPAVLYVKAGKATFSLGIGAAFWTRYAFLADSVPQEEAGDIARMNDFFYQGLRYLYPSVHLAYDYTTDSGMKGGIVIKAFLPLESLHNDLSLDAGIASITFRLSFPNRHKETEEESL